MGSTVEQLLAAIDETAGENLTGYSDAALLDRQRTLETARRKLDSATVASVAAIHQRGAADHDGARSTQSWLQTALMLTSHAAGKLLTAARHLTAEPTFAPSFAAGQVGLDHVLVAARLAKAVGPEHATEAVEALLEPAERMDAATLTQVAKYLKTLLRPDHDGPEPDPDADRSVFVAQTFEGTGDLSGKLTPEGTELLQTYLEATAGKRDAEDDRQPCQRRHDALLELIRHGLSTMNLPTMHGEAPHLGVIVHASDLHTTPSGKHRLKPTTDWADDQPDPVPPDWDDNWDTDTDIDWDHIAATWAQDHTSTQAPTGATASRTAVATGTGIDPALRQVPPDDGPIPDATWPDTTTLAHQDPTPADLVSAAFPTGSRTRIPAPGTGGRTHHGALLPPTTMHRLACEAALHRIILDTHDIPISTGHRVRLPGAPLRRLITARDGGCRFHGCTAPPAWTEPHHIIAWANGGPTELTNLLSLCGFHHHRIHDHGWSIAFDGRTVTIRRPDGSTLDPP